MVCDFTASDELCSAPLPFRFMTGLWLVAPCSLSSTLPFSLSAPERCARNRSLAHVTVIFVSLSLRQNGVQGIARSLT